MTQLNLLMKRCFLLVLFSLVTAFSTFGLEGYKDHEGNAITFGVLETEKGTGDQERKVFLDSFFQNYQSLNPDQIKPHFKSKDDVSEWLKAVYKDEWEYLCTPANKAQLVDLFKNGKLIGFVIIEPWKGDKSTIHLRQMAILSTEQRHGYGAALLKALRKLPEINVKSLVADTRKLNKKALQFYLKNGFVECTPHDPELNKEFYTGLEWHSSKVN